MPGVMATITALVAGSGSAFYAGDKGVKYVSALATAGTDTTVIMDKATSKMGLERYAHVFVGVKMFSDAAGATQIVDTTGTGVFTVSMQTVNTGGDTSISALYQSPENATITATAPHTVDASGNFTAIKVVASGLAETVTWQVVVTANTH